MEHNAMGMDPCDNQNDAIFNITTDKRTHVDARTGLFEAHVPLPSVTGNVGYGPVVDLSLYYSPVVNNHAALGDGWSFAFTTWYEKNSDLTLHTGEALRVEKGKDLVTPAVMVTWSDGGNTLTVERKDGRVEILRKPEAGRVWVPARLTTDGYRYLDFTWATVAQTVGKDTYHQVRLTGIHDPDRTLLDVSYGPDETLPAKVTLTFWPETNETLQFVLDIKDVALQSVTAPEGTKTTFGYLEHPTCGWLLNAVETFEGLKEDVAYADNGLKFKDDPKLSALPAVSTHSISPRACGEPIIDVYTYSWRDQSSRKDVPRAYVHYQTEVERAGRTTVYSYRKDHSLLSEYTVEGSHRQLKTFKDSANASHPSDIMKSVKTILDRVEVKSDYSHINRDGLCLKMDRSAYSIFTYDAPSTPAGTESEFRQTYITSETSGSIDNFATPRDSRDMEKIVRGLRPLLRKSYRYRNISGLNRKKPSFISTDISVGSVSNDHALMGQSIDYFENDDELKGRHRRIMTGNIENPGSLASETIECVEFAYALDATRHSITTTTGRSRGGISRTCIETRSFLSGRILEQIDADGNRTDYDYDMHGRLSARTTCAQSTVYKETTGYSYPTIGRIEIMESDGRKRAIESDGRDNTVREQLWHEPTLTWRDVSSNTYDKFGRKNMSLSHDYLSDGLIVTEKCTFEYDFDGNECCCSFSDGRKTFNTYDPLSRTRNEWTGRATDKQRTRTTYNRNGTINEIDRIDQHGRSYQRLAFRYTAAGAIESIETSENDSKRYVSHEYDAVGRTIREDHAAGDSVHSYVYTYQTDWSNSSPIKIEKLDGNTICTLGERTFDPWGRVISITRAGLSETYAYEGAKAVPDSKKFADGNTIYYKYISELGNSLAKITDASGLHEKHFEYAHGQQRTSVAAEGEALLACDHDLDDQVIKARVKVRGGTEKTIRQNWSPGGRLLSETDVLGKITSYRYNELGQRDRTYSGELITTHEYDERGHLSKETVSLGADTVTVVYAFDNLGHETARSFHHSSGYELSIERRHMGARLMGTRIVERNRIKSRHDYTYTVEGRIASCISSGEWLPRNPKGKPIDHQFYSYDSLGNVTERISFFGSDACVSTYTYDELFLNRLTSVEHSHADYRHASELEYDANGRVTRDSSGKKYAYDWLGRLVKAGSRLYSYDAMDRLATTGKNEEELHLIYNGPQLRGEYGSAGQARYFEPGSLACTLQRVQRSGVNRTLFEFRDDDGTVLVTYDATANTATYHAYSAYGEHTSEEADSLSGFNGEYRDAQNDQYPLGQGYRTYDPDSMRFQAPDDASPFGRGGPNAYAYCGGDPVNISDPSGHWGSIGSGKVNRGLRAIWGDRLPGPLSMGSGGALIGTIIWSGLGVVTAIMTGGASLALSAALVGVAFVASATAIASVVVADTNPELAAILGWVSLGFTVAGGVASLAKKVGEFAMKIGRSGMAVARNAYHRVAVAVSRSRAHGVRSVFRSRASAYRPSAAEGYDSLEQLGEVRPPASPTGALVFSSIEDGYSAAFDFTLPPPEQRGAFLSLLDKVNDALNVGDINTVVCTVTGVLGNAGYFDSEQDAFINGNINNSTWLPWGSFNLGRYGSR